MNAVTVELHKRVLVSNRGEIAIRIAKAAAALGMESVGVYANVDSLSLHTRVTTQAHEIGTGEGADPVRAYLDAQALVQTAKKNACDCVHPGYGFLAENAEFARLCAAEGLTFIGPSPAALSLFGDKIQARALAQSLDIPIVSGSTAPLTSSDDALLLAEELGYPLMLKARAGGGGRGMRVVENAAEMADAFARCRSEAQAAFGNDEVFLEQLIGRPRHIEVQILADTHGSVVHLHERDCSIQHRNQKVVEMAPAPAFDSELREKILDDAIRLVQAAEYVNAGTVEFLVSPETHEYFFIECNPRIQVEHTVTEQVTGIDIVEAQFRIAAGATLASLGLADQSAVGAPRGFAVQARVVAQGGGTITAYKDPSGPGVRVDAAGYLGYTPPPQFDPLLAKVIGFSSHSHHEAPTAGASTSFSAAIDRTLRALDEFHIGGLPTNLPQLRAILSHADVRAGHARTSLLTEAPELMHASATSNGAMLSLLQHQAATIRTTPALAATGPTAESSLPALEVADRQQAVACPMAGFVVELGTKPGDTVAAGDTLLVISAMKMETMVTAPCAGIVHAMQALSVDDNVVDGQIVVVLDPAQANATRTAQTDGAPTWPALQEPNWK